MDIDIHNVEKKYGIIYSDPPWQQKKGNLRKCRPNQTKTLDYETLPIEQIAEIHGIASKIADTEHNFFVWTIDKYLHDTEHMMGNLGYTLHARIIWDKENGVAPAFTVRFTHEYLLWFYTKGKMLKPVPEMRGKFTTVLREHSVSHSRKPSAAYIMLETMFPAAKKLELFARNHRYGWDAWGNETDKFDGVG